MVIRFGYFSNLSDFAADNIFVSGRLNKKKLQTEVEHALNVRHDMKCHWSIDRRGDTPKFNPFTIYLNTNVICSDLVSHIHDINTYIDFVCYEIRHEIGHMIDRKKFLSMTREEVDEIKHQEMLLRDEFNKSTAIDDWENYIREYHKLPAEAMADRCGHFDVERYIDFLKCIRYASNEMTLSIDCKIKT